MSKAPAVSVRRMRQAISAPARPTMRNPGSRPSRRKPLVRCKHRMSGPILAGALLALPGLAAAEGLRSYAVNGDAIPLSLTGTPGDPARGRSWCQSHQHLHPLPQRTVSGGEIPGRSCAQPCRFRQPLVRRPASAAAGRRQQPQSRDDHAVILSHRRIGARWIGMARQADPVGGADRGYGGVSRRLA